MNDAGAPADIGSWQADLDPSSARYAARFSGPTGEWLLSRQTDALMRLAARYPGARVLDVGGGHGQTAAPLIAAGHDVTVLASSEAAFGRAAALTGARLVAGALMAPPFPDRSFDLVVSVRMLAHIGDWRRYLSGLTRVARRAVIVDFPIPGGANALGPLLFGLKRRLEGDTRRYETMSKADVRAAFAHHGFAPAGEIGQFVLPMAVHRGLKAPRLSGALEGALGGIGLARAFGAPVVMAAERRS